MLLENVIIHYLPNFSRKIQILEKILYGLITWFKSEESFCRFFCRFNQTMKMHQIMNDGYCNSAPYYGALHFHYLPNYVSCCTCFVPTIADAVVRVNNQYVQLFTLACAFKWQPPYIYSFLWECRYKMDLLRPYCNHLNNIMSAYMVMNL